MTFAYPLAVLNASAATLETHLLQIQVVTALPSRTFRVFASIVVNIVGLVGLIDGETSLAAVLLIRRVLEVLTTER